MFPHRGQIRITLSDIEWIGIISDGMELCNIRQIVIVAIIKAPSVQYDSYIGTNELILLFKCRKFIVEVIIEIEVVIIHIEIDLHFLILVTEAS